MLEPVDANRSGRFASMLRRRIVWQQARQPLGWRARGRLAILGFRNVWKAQWGIWTGMDPGQVASIRIGAWRQLHRARYGRA